MIANEHRRDQVQISVLPEEVVEEDARHRLAEEDIGPVLLETVDPDLDFLLQHAELDLEGGIDSALSETSLHLLELLLREGELVLGDLEELDLELLHHGLVERETIGSLWSEGKDA